MYYKYYIPGLIRIKSNVRSDLSEYYMETELEGHKDEDIILIYIVSNKRFKEIVSEYRYDYYINPFYIKLDADMIVFNIKKLIFSPSFIVKGLESRLTMFIMNHDYYIYNDLLPFHYKFDMVIDSILGFKLLRNRLPMLHAASFCDDDNNAFILTGYSNSGKTHTVVTLCTSKEGKKYYLMSDDYSALSPQGLVYGILKRMALSYDSNHIANVVTNKMKRLQLTLSCIVSKSFPSFLYKLLKVKPKAEIDPICLTSRIKSVGNLKIVFFLFDSSHISVRELGKSEALSLLMNISLTEIYWHYNPLITAYCYARNISIIDKINTELYLLSSGIEKSRFFIVCAPVKEIPKIISNLINRIK